ncbi:4-hydroxy-tetrahydrodipicolinate reductase [Quadrisphaera sp. DSM 44207]|uniref:4-hydroxy-tetrahydrodipicolinate reductase n=1 Tax=Quadrisphaera sp. DSM 44207 TaxID=1881057 RepID=UPI00088C784C|nr:4-hydroxy-tetrahydrodipicolinate reductase [Quadrisphaera sp. DSM 44207]SDQ77185.1 dihydrodipicolinate reductase [Quadrisphaera sp. DSM 44207]
MAPLRVAVVGAGGRMGTAACAAVEAADDLQLVARIGRGDDVREAARAGADVAVELSVPSAAPHHVSELIDAGVHVVVGTTGWDDAALTRLRGELAHPSVPEGVGVLIAPNFALGAVLLMRFAAQAAPYFESVEVVELHHPAKVDAPSGTAVRTAELIAAARREAGAGPAPDATSSALDGARGAPVAGVPVHSVRLRGLTASQEVLLGSAGEVLALRHDATERSAFMPGLLLGVRRVAGHPGLTVGLEHYLDLG